MNNLTTIFVVFYKETELNDGNITATNCGVCEEGYLDEQKAIEQVEVMANEKIKELATEYDDENIIINSSDNGDYKCISTPVGCYEYYVSSCYHTNG